MMLQDFLMSDISLWDEKNTSDLTEIPSIKRPTQVDTVRDLPQVPIHPLGVLKLLTQQSIPTDRSVTLGRRQWEEYNYLSG